MAEAYRSFRHGNILAVDFDVYLRNLWEVDFLLSVAESKAVEYAYVLVFTICNEVNCVLAAQLVHIF